MLYPEWPKTPSSFGYVLKNITGINWVWANSIHRARASAVLYSIVKMTIDNDLRVYNYLEYLSDELVKHAEDTS